MQCADRPILESSFKVMKDYPVIARHRHQLEKKLLSTEVRPTALSNPWAGAMTLTFDPLRAMIMAYSYAKCQRQRSTDGRTEAIALPAVLMRWTVAGRYSDDMCVGVWTASSSSLVFAHVTSSVAASSTDRHLGWRTLHSHTHLLQTAQKS